MRKYNLGELVALITRLFLRRETNTIEILKKLVREGKKYRYVHTPIFTLKF